MRKIIYVILVVFQICPASAEEICARSPFRFQDKGEYSVEIQKMINFLSVKWGGIPQDRLTSLVQRNSDRNTWGDDFKRNELISDQFYYRFGLMEKELAVLNRARKILFINSDREYVAQIVELIVELNNLHNTMETFYKKSVFRPSASLDKEFEISSSIMINKAANDALYIFRCNYGIKK